MTIESKEVKKSNEPADMIKNLYLPTDGLIDKAGSLYALCNMAMKRARQLSLGKESLCKDCDQSNPVMIALEEIRRGLIESRE